MFWAENIHGMMVIRAVELTGLLLILNGWCSWMLQVWRKWSLFIQITHLLYFALNLKEQLFLNSSYFLITWLVTKISYLLLRGVGMISMGLSILALVWRKLINVKSDMNQLRQYKFSNLDDRAKNARSKLLDLLE